MVIEKMNNINSTKGVYDYSPPSPKEESEITCNWNKGWTKPIATILCTTFQHKNYIKNAIDSFLMQETTFPFEIIVRDDASTDGTKEIVKEYQRNYPNIIKVILEEENQFSKGVKPTMSILPLAKGKYVALCEGDDFWTDEHKLQKQVSFLEENDEYVIVYSDAVVIDENYNIERNSLLEDRKNDYSKNELILSASIPTLTRCFRNVLKVIPKELDYVKNGDTFIISLLAEYGGAKYLSDIKQSVYRKHGGGIWAGINEQNKRIMLGTTFYWMSLYYKRIGMGSVAERYAHNAILQFSRPLNIKKRTAFKIFLYLFSPCLILKLKNIFRLLSK